MEGPFYTYLYILDKLIFQNEVQRVLYKLVLVTLSIILKNLQLFKLQVYRKNKKNQICPYTSIPYMGVFS